MSSSVTPYSGLGTPLVEGGGVVVVEGGGDVGVVGCVVVPGVVPVDELVVVLLVGVAADPEDLVVIAFLHRVLGHLCTPGVEGVRNITQRRPVTNGPDPAVAARGTGRGATGAA